MSHAARDATATTAMMASCHAASAFGSDMWGCPLYWTGLAALGV
jgi:hypothetical protein